MTERTGFARALPRLVIAALPAALAALSVLLLSGAFALKPRPRAAQLVAFAFLAQVAALVGARRLKRDPRACLVPSRYPAEEGALLVLAALALTQASGGVQSPLYALLYLLGAAFVLMHPLPLALGLISFALMLDGALFSLAGALRKEWPVLAAHAGFVALFATLYHALLAARLRAARKAEARAVSLRLAQAELSAREYRLVATAEAGTEPPEARSVGPGRALLGGVSEVEAQVRGALQIAEQALALHTAALFLAAPGGETLQLRECLSASDRLFRGPLPRGEGALGAALAAECPVRLHGDGAALAYYEGRAPVGAFLGVKVEGAAGAIGVLAADRREAFSEADERLLAQLAAQISRAIDGERVLAAVRREKDEKARFFRALEELNKTSTVAEAAKAAVEQARALCPALDLVALTLVDAAGDSDITSTHGRPRRARHTIAAAAGEGHEALCGLSFADNPGLVCNVVRLSAPLPARPPGAMERLVIFDSGTVIRGLRSLKIFPLRAGEETAGALVCASRSEDALPESAQRELALLGAQAAGALLRARLHDRAETLATTDGLTGLVNRRSMDAQLLARLREATRYGRKLSFILLDVDHFKRVNDQHGHPAGDAVLRGVAAVLKEQARATDVAARYGGEEMALVLPETDAAGARVIAERLRAAVAAASYATEQGALRVTVSLGVSTAPGDGSSLEALIEAADRALYRAKQAGRNRVECARTQAAA